jgi:hypothetical protein
MSMRIRPICKSLHTYILYAHTSGISANVLLLQVETWKVSVARVPSFYVNFTTASVLPVSMPLVVFFGC